MQYKFFILKVILYNFPTNKLPPNLIQRHKEHKDTKKLTSKRIQSPKCSTRSSKNEAPTTSETRTQPPSETRTQDLRKSYNDSNRYATSEMYQIKIPKHYKLCI